MIMDKMGPKSADHASVGTPCPACGRPFKSGEYTTLIALGPGDDPEARRKARTDQIYDAVALEVHWACATGHE